MRTCALDLCHSFGVKNRLDLLKWLGLWLIAKHSLGVWLNVPSTKRSHATSRPWIPSRARGH
jgi:hypothetical protein